MKEQSLENTLNKLMQMPQLAALKIVGAGLKIVVCYIGNKTIIIDNFGT
jgi:hypothetical protein